MATITAATLDSRLHLEDAATNTDLENLIDGAIDLLNVTVSARVTVTSPHSATS